LRVADMERSIDFYTRALGFEVARTLEHEGEPFWAWLSAGPLSLMISRFPARSLEHGEDEEHEHPEWTGASFINPGPDLDVLTFLYVESVDAAYARVVAAGFETIDAPRETTHGTREFLVQDPDGYYYAIAERL
jgi:catechol 2,3-dioxygenase-like lactoylglutathione lyase family enzyme